MPRAARKRLPEPPPPAQTAAAGLRARILIVDDDERNAFAAVQALDGLGHELVTARSGEEALRRLLVEDYAVILLDLHMPGMDGYETAALIRGRRRTSRVPIVFLTAVFRDESHLFQAYSAGAVDVVFKPVDPFILRSKVSILVDLHLKTIEAQREAEHRQRLLEENIRVREGKMRAEAALRRAQERQDVILQSLPIIFHSRSFDPPFHPLFVSESVEAVSGFSASRIVDEPDFASSRIHPDDLERVVEAVSRARITGSYACEYRWRCADGAYRTFLDHGVVAPASEGGASEIFGVLLDVTERRSLEEQLTHARKMEAVGQLTGGVAHDFNNLLTVILGNVELLSRRTEREAQKERRLAAIAHAADRGRSLTRQLLAFSRRQHLKPVVLDVRALIGAFLPLMKQAVGEAITLSCDFDGDQLPTRADAAQLETALLNLAVNARDAMPNGGAICIRARCLGDKAAPPVLSGDGAAQRWIEIEVRDSGVGMAPEVVDRAFEPFFTTKEIGKGSGLGLSQVYGFVRQSGGHVLVDSQPGEGTVVRLLLPSTDEAVCERAEASAAPASGGQERLLVVEDDESVRALTVELLSSLGYGVVTACDAGEALRRLERDQAIDLLFSDVVMPGGMNGVHLARAARERRPELKVLLTSGYLGANAALTENEFPLIDKPYDRNELAARLRALLEAGEGQAMAGAA